MTASGVGVGSCLAMDDQPRLRRLAGELAAVDQLRTLALAADPGLMRRALGFDADRRYLSGLLYGDAVLFYALTWVDWKTAGK